MHEKACPPQFMQTDLMSCQGNGGFKIYSGKMIIETEKYKECAEGTVEFVWQPSPCLVVKASVEEPVGSEPPDGKEVKLHIHGYQPSRVLIYRSSWRPTWTFSGLLRGYFAEQVKEVTTLLAHLVNFKNTLGDPLGAKVDDNECHYAGRIRLDCDEWDIIMDKIPQYADVFQRLRNKSGYAITHVARISRSDGEVFEPSDTDRVRQALYWMLSFAGGGRVGIGLLEGKGPTGETVWQRFSGLGYVFPWQQTTTWFSSKTPEPLGVVFPSFLRLLHNPTWAASLRFAIGTYCEAKTNSNTEAGIVFSQMGLETMAWTMLTQENQVMREPEFKKKCGSSILRELISRAGISTELPTSIRHHLRRHSLGQSPTGDGPYVLTEMRNAIVHPSDKRSGRQMSNKTKHKILQLGLQYLELAILKRLGYQGKVQDQLEQGWKGAFTLVPWAHEK